MVAASGHCWSVCHETLLACAGPLVMSRAGLKRRGGPSAALSEDATPEERAKAAASHAAHAASALAGRDKYGLPLELDMENYDNEDAGAGGRWGGWGVSRRVGVGRDTPPCSDDAPHGIAWKLLHPRLPSRCMYVCVRACARAHVGDGDLRTVPCWPCGAQAARCARGALGPVRLLHVLLP